MAEARIVSDPTVMLGKPVVAGTRIAVELILEKLAAGEPVAQIQRAHPRLPTGAVEAALAYAVALVRKEVVPPHQEDDWRAETARRVAAVRAGRVAGRPLDDVAIELRKTYS